MGAWIETDYEKYIESLTNVAPCMGAWIETFPYRTVRPNIYSRTLYGCVD